MGKTEKLPVVREDLTQFRFVSEVSLSPDGRRAVYVVNRADGEENCYHSGVWMLDLASRENRMLAERGDAKSPLWLDSGTVLFASGRAQTKEDAKKATDYYAISVEGGEARRFMTVPAKVEKLTPVKDGLWLVTSAVEEYKTDTAGGSEAVRGVDYEIYEELPFWFNGKGVCSRKRAALHLFSQADGSFTRVTPELLETVSSAVSPDGSKIAFSGPRYQDVRPTTSALYLYTVADGSLRQLTDETSVHISNLCFMGNDAIFYGGTPFDQPGRNPRYCRYDLTAGESREFPFCDADIVNSVGSDAQYGKNRSMAYCEANGLLYLLQTSWGDSHLMAMDGGGALRQVTREQGAVAGFDVKLPQGAGEPVIVLSALRGQRLAELYLLNPATGEEEKLTGFNDAYLESHTISVPERFRYQSRNGYEMEAYIMKPAGYEPGKKYPAVFEIHGGPKGVWGTLFFHEFQCLTSAGYFVFYGNPRGSDGRGERYANLAGVFGKDDFDDLMELFDETLKRYPDVDGERTGICGGSYGGFMCNWMVGHTDRFKAAVSQRSISNYLTKCLYTDIGYYANRLQIGAFPWEDFQKVWAASPLNGAAKARTPLLLLQSDEDYRCYMGDAMQMFSAVKRQGTDVRMVLFHGENHELSRGGKPQNRQTRLRELLDWFARYLKDGE